MEHDVDPRTSETVEQMAIGKIIEIKRWGEEFNVFVPHYVQKFFI